MGYVKFVVLMMSFALIGGCSTKGDLKACRQQNETLQASLAKVEQNLAQEKVTHEADVVKLNAESNKMQTDAMQSITKMLGKDKELQDKLVAQINDLKGTNAKLEAELKALAQKNAALQVAEPNAQ